MLEEELRAKFSLKEDALAQFLENEAQIKPDDTKLISEPDISLWVTKGSILNPTTLVIKGRYVFTGDISPSNLLLLLNEDRTKWDTSIMHQEILKKLSDSIHLFYYVTEPALSSSLPGDFVEKRVRFVKDSVYYGYCSSVPEKVVASKEIYSRGKTIFGGSILKQEEGRNVYYSFSQVKLKVFADVMW
eukprot:TRINITY_DN8774_c0_g5_i2.p1 TRINITY_DN8774_c0_g5~~TRINITY_DN8774_c0_g5_i2.p1  ORF type:complete len:188 (+),score=40.38 TRINITY_DN8774_c0_g5_i2:171-734(+)